MTRHHPIGNRAQDRAARLEYPAVRRLALAVAALSCAAAATACGRAAATVQPAAGVTGIVRDHAGAPVQGALVAATRATRKVTFSTATGPDGRFALELPADAYSVLARFRNGGASAPAEVQVSGSGGAIPVELVIDPRDAGWRDAPSARLLSWLPEGETKRRFILDCTGCHTFDAQTVTAPDGSRLKSRDEWLTRTAQMISFSGAGSGFPIMSAARDAAATATWLAEHLGSDPVALERARTTPLPPHTLETPGALLTEYEYPVPGDLPHDVMVDIDGRIVVTGMFSHQMWLLDPESGEWAAPIDVPGGNPRALDIDAEGNWYVALGAPRRIAFRERATGAWSGWDIGEYPHSVQLDADGRLWFNGHFSRAPERIGYVRRSAVAGAASASADTEVRHFHIPPEPPDEGITIQYGLRTATDGAVWTTQLAGNRLIRFSGAGATEGGFRSWTLPTMHSGPRRPDLDAAGVVWIPEYSNNRLARFDPRTGTFTEWELPIPDALPYVVRIDRSRNRIWIGTAAADAILRFDPVAHRFFVYGLPTRGALIRHLDVDERTGDVWAAYGASPGRSPNRIARLRIPGA